jgi:hypothetical protein
MARLNVLTGEAIATPPAPPPPVKRSSRKSKAQAPRAPKVSTLPGIIAAFPQSMFAILTNNPEDANPARAEAVRENFLKYAHSHPNATNWRTAFDAFWHIQNTDRGTGETTRISANVAPLLTRAFPKNLRRMLAARNDAIAFDAAIRGRVAFSRTYEAKGNRDGLPDITVEVLPPAQCPVNIPAVGVTTCIGLRLVFAVIELDAWLPYEHHLESVGLHSLAYDDGVLYPKASKAMGEIVGVMARNLGSPAWCNPPREEIGGNVGALIKSALDSKSAAIPSGNADGKVVRFPNETRDILERILASEMPRSPEPEVKAPAVFATLRDAMGEPMEWDDMTPDQRRQHMALGYAPHVNDEVYRYKRGKARESARQRLAREIYYFLQGYSDAELPQLCMAHVARDFGAKQHTH